MAARGNINDFISQINAKPGYSTTVNADGSVKISKNGAVKYPRVFWNIQIWGAIGHGMPGRASKDGSTINTTVSGLCEIIGGVNDGYPTDSVTFVDGGAATSAAAQFFLDGLAQHVTSSRPHSPRRRNTPTATL
jgi:hypothetical protein